MSGPVLEIALILADKIRNRNLLIFFLERSYYSASMFPIFFSTEKRSYYAFKVCCRLVIVLINAINYTLASYK